MLLSNSTGRSRSLLRNKSKGKSKGKSKSKSKGRSKGKGKSKGRSKSKSKGKSKSKCKGKSRAMVERFERLWWCWQLGRSFGYGSQKTRAFAQDDEFVWVWTGSRSVAALRMTCFE